MILINLVTKFLKVKIRNSTNIFKVNFDFTRKIDEILMGKKFVKTLRVCRFLLLTPLISREKLGNFFMVKKS